MNIDEYVADEAYNRSGHENWLIHREYGEIKSNPALTRSSEKALAELANAIHKNAPELEPEQLEQAVRWLKTWKHKNNPGRPQSRSVWDYYSTLEQLRNSREQVTLQNRVVGQLAIAALFAIAMLVTLSAGTVAHYAGDGIGWGWRALNLALFLGFFAGANKYMRKGLMTAKEQDRKYLMASIRAATTASEVGASGLFAYLPGTVWQERQKGDDALAHKSMRAAREQLTDALYHDPEDYLGPFSTLLRT